MHRFCCRRRSTPDPVLEPLSPKTLSVASETASEGTRSGTTTEASDRPTGGQVTRETLWVIPLNYSVRPRGAYFGHEGLTYPTAPGLDLRFYAVWDIPGVGRWRVAGIHWGIGTTAYSSILSLHGGEHRGIAYRRFESLEAAQEGFCAEVDCWDLSPRLARRIFGWTFCHDLEAR